MDNILDGGVNEFALYYGLGGAIALFAIILFVLCVCLCYVRCCKQKPKPRPKSAANGKPVSFTGNFESRDSIVEDTVHSAGMNHIYEDLDTIKMEKAKLEEKEREKSKANPENGEKETDSIANGVTTLVTVDENTIPRGGHVHVTNGMPNGVISTGGTATIIVTNGTLPHTDVPNGGVPNGGVPNGGVPNGMVHNGGIPNGGVPNGMVPNGGVPNGVSSIEVPNGRVPNGDVPTKGVSNVEVTNERAPNGILTNQNVSAAVFTAQVPVSYQNRSQTLPNGVGSRKKGDDEPIYARPGRYFRTGKKKTKKTPPKVKFNVPHGLGPGDTLPKTPTTPKTPELPPKRTDVMY